ncbi:hypothetical protein DNH61_14940 [Paenibacillus sambharensis]|uniref:Uncharacterized protein n=1 Tax=Paenibacillus sambharensis TaxID=1803190 RepID=A0A2W1LTZ2_9BACL|nr:hypothetical protein [Paenibacillus sambharensis]PZD94937.1 hypothetical protein DNH61_14940 [Paenibacillus sambharensis]
MTKQPDKKPIRRVMELGAILLMTGSILSACSGGDEVNQPTPNHDQQTADPTDPQQGRTSPDSGDVTEDNPGAAPSAPDSDTNNPADEAITDDDADQRDTGDGNVIQGQGTYTGQPDNHSVEIMTEEGPMVLQIDEDIALVLEGIEPDSKVRYDYIEKQLDVNGDTVTQRWLTDIKLD